MQVTHKFKIPYDELLYQQLKKKQLETGKLWTDILQYSKHHYQGFRSWISKGELEKLTKNTYDLSSQTVQAIVAKYEINRQSAKENRKSNKKIKYPWKYKRFFCIPYKQASLEIQSTKIILKNSDYSSSVSVVSLTKLMNKKKLTKKDKQIYDSIPKQKDYIEIPNLLPVDIASISYAEVVFKNGNYWFHYVVDVPEKENTYKFKPAGGDLGEIHSLTVATEDKALIISGRAIRSLKQYKAKFLADLGKKMSRCKKYSRQWKKYNQAKKRLMNKTNEQLDYLFHKTTKQAIDFLIQEQVTDFVVGNPEGIEKNTKKHKKQNRTRRQQLSVWSYGKFKNLLKYKVKINGINLHFTEESYTSQDCPLCGGRHKANGRNFKCTVHNTVLHRDVNGAQNIARKLFRMDSYSVEINYQQPVWFRKQYKPESIACGMA